MRIMKHCLMCICILSSQLIMGQPWMKNLKTANPEFREIQKAFYDYWKDKPVEKGQGYKAFKRWEYYWETRILENGKFPTPSITWDEWKKYTETHPQLNPQSATAANWIFEGPSSTPGGYRGLGRLNCIAFHPTDVNTFWVGSPAGGLWKTTTGGSSWSTNTDNLPVLGVSDIAIDPSNANIMYLATGDGDMGGGGPGDTRSVGILKSTNGGSTWNTTGLNFSVSAEKLIRRLLINPANPQILIAAASDGIWRTVNGGTSWTNTQTGHFTDLEFKPGDPTIVYASTYDYWGNAKIYRSTNSGASWNSVATMTDVIRINLAVSPHSPALVDALCANSQSGLAGLWYSTNSGASFVQYLTGTNTNNYLHNSWNASGTGGQGHYDLAYALNPLNADDIWLGGVNTWNSLNGGSVWTLKTIWASGFPTAANVVHADKHFIAFHPLQPGTMFECNDGGLYKTANGGVTWTDLSNGLQISQFYRVGTSQTEANRIIGGMQDNGSRELWNNAWYERTGGDGMDCSIDYTIASTQYGSYVNGEIYRTNNSWLTQTTISDNIPGQPTGAWLTPFVLHPSNPNILFAGYNKVFKTINQGNSWTAISPVLTVSDNIRSIAVAPSNANTIYAATLDTLFFTSNGGTNWYYTLLGIPNLKISSVTVNPTNSQTIYVTVSGYSSGNKVFMSPNSGVTWYNYSGTLPNVPVNCIVYQNGTNEGLYIGTDVGVFYTDASMPDWITYQTGLPNVVVNELEIAYNNNKLWAATYGRGLWSSGLYNTTVYTFTGNGNWNVSSNWANNTMPPATLSAGSEIIINHTIDGECILNIPYTVAPGGKLTVPSGKRFKILGNLTISP